MKRNLKYSEPLNINTGLFELDTNKGTAISIMNKVLNKIELKGISKCKSSKIWDTKLFNDSKNSNKIIKITKIIKWSRCIVIFK